MTTYPPAEEPSLPAYSRLRAPEWAQPWRLGLVTLTPILGGGVVTRRVDPLSPVRATSIRGQLRIWWRALYAHGYASAAELLSAERSLWGGIARKHKEVTASGLRVVVRSQRNANKDNANIEINETALDKNPYALWTARKTQQEGPAERWLPGLEFDLEITPTRDLGERRQEVDAAVRAWLLFGGVGGRTRRGCGAVGLKEGGARKAYLPQSLEELKSLFALRPGTPSETPSLFGAAFQFGATTGDAIEAWSVAVGWLQQFRQGVRPDRVDSGDIGDFARKRPSLDRPPRGRPGRSRWPEADKLRHLFGAYDHAALPGHGAEAYWPRAEFGLPLPFQFTSNPRPGAADYPALPPPKGLTLHWTLDGKEVIERLASPLIVKPVQLRNGQFVPLALWLNRSLPRTARVGVVEAHTDYFVDKSLAPLGASRPPADQAHFRPAAGPSLRDSFLAWVSKNGGISGGTL